MVGFQEKRRVLHNKGDNAVVLAVSLMWPHRLGMLGVYVPKGVGMVVDENVKG